MDWIKEICGILQALLTPTIAGVVAYVAYQQWKTNTDKLKLDLYDRRLRVCQSTMGFLAGILQRAAVDHEDVVKFIRETAEGYFLFDKEIFDYLCTLQENAGGLRETSESLTGLPVGEERNKMVEKERRLIDWFVEQVGVAPEKFKKYLTFPS